MVSSRLTATLLTALLFHFPIQSSAQNVILSADANMISALDPALTSQTVGDLAVRPTGMEQLLVNILQGGSQVFIDQYSGHSNRGVIGGYEQLFNYYNSLPGITASMPGGDFTSIDLAATDLLITSVPNVAYTVDELQAMSDLLGGGGTIFFLGGEGQNFTGSTVFINDALSFLGSDLILEDNFIAVPGWPFYTTSVNTTHPLMSGVPNLSVAVSGSVSAGEALAFYIHGGVEYAVLAFEGGVGGSPDSDGDGVPDEDDICPGFDDNSDTDGDFVPDGCDPCPNDAQNDADGDGVCGDVDTCPGGDDNQNADGDALPDFCDVCPLDEQNDADDDGICEVDDNCEAVSNPDQIDSDDDGFGDACDPDIDGDGVVNEDDNCLFDANPDQADIDNDGAGDVCDDDIDGDGVVDALDACVPTPVGEVVDAEGCSIGELCPCENDWKNHGAYVRCMAHTSEDFVDAGLITESEKDSIVSAAGQSGCGHKN